METKLENQMATLGPFKGVVGIYRDITSIMENQMEKRMAGGRVYRYRGHT